MAKETIESIFYFVFLLFCAHVFAWLINKVIEKVFGVDLGFGTFLRINSPQVYISLGRDGRATISHNY